jgi:hypothetical protein
VGGGVVTNQEWTEMFRVIPEADQNTIVIVLQNGCEINVDTFISFEPNFLVMRGRVGGQTEDGRGFFVPYDQMLYFRLERLTNLAELRELMGGRSAKAARAPAAPAETAPAADPAALESVVSPASPPVAPVTDATANRNALLDRIRAARVTQVATNRLLTQ